LHVLHIVSCGIAENLIKSNTMEDSGASWNEHPARASAVQFQDDTNFENDDKEEVGTSTLRCFVICLFVFVRSCISQLILMNILMLVGK